MSIPASATPQPRAELQEIAGPTAAGGGLRRFLDLLWLVSSTEFRLGYHGTVLGFAWSFLRPLMLFAVLLLVFTQIFKFGDDVKNYPAMLLFNIMLFTFFADTTGQAVISVVKNENIVRKMQFPRLVIPLAVVLSNAFQLVLSLIVVFIFMLIYGVEPIWTWALVPLLIGAMVVFTTAISMLVSVLYVRIRDVVVIWALLSTMLFYAAPVLYPIEDAPNGFREIIQLNPLSPMFEQGREWIVDSNAPGAVEAAMGNQLLVLVPAALFVLICGLSVWIFKREAPRIAESL